MGPLPEPSKSSPLPNESESQLWLRRCYAMLPGSAFLRQQIWNFESEGDATNHWIVTSFEKQTLPKFKLQSPACLKSFAHWPRWKPCLYTLRFTFECTFPGLCCKFHPCGSEGDFERVSLKVQYDLGYLYAVQCLFEGAASLFRKKPC